MTHNLYSFLKLLDRNVYVPVNSPESTLKFIDSSVDMNEESAWAGFVVGPDTLARMFNVNRTTAGGLYAGFMFSGQAILPPNRFGLETKPCSRMFNNSFVKNGKLLVTDFYFYATSDFVSSLPEDVVINPVGTILDDMMEYHVDLTQFDLYSKADEIDATALTDVVRGMIESKIVAKVVDSIITAAIPQYQMTEEELWLKSVGVTDFFTTPQRPSPKPERDVQFKIKSFSNIPSMNEYNKAKASGKALKPSIQAIDNVYKEYSQYPIEQLMTLKRQISKDAQSITNGALAHATWNLLYGGSSLTGGTDDISIVIHDVKTTMSIVY